MNRITTLTLLILTSCPFFAAEDLTGYVPEPAIYHKYSVGHTKEALPSSYDSRDYGYITASRNQQINGSCWAFATCDAVEALSATEGFNDGYLSPQLFTNCHDGFLFTKSQGGNSDMSVALMARLEGPAYEDSIPFIAADTECMEHSTKEYPAYILGSYILPENDVTAIKECIMEYGAVFAQMYYNSSYYDSKTNTYSYTAGTDIVNHAISLIGWDDEEQVFLAKFNYGTKVFDNGVMKVSYSDAYIASGCTAFTQRVEKSEIDTAYYYDKTGYKSELSQPEINKYSAISYFNAPQGDTLKYVGSYVSAPESNLTFTVMVGTDIYTKSIYCKYQGFYSVKMDEDIILNGDFIVAADYEGSLPIETKIENYNEPIFIPKGKQYFQIDGKEPSYPVGSDVQYWEEVNLCVRAYTKHQVVIPTDVNTTTSNKVPVVIDGKINPAIWENGSEIDVFALDGSFKQHLKQNIATNLKGLFIFVVRYPDGVSSSIELLK